MLKNTCTRILNLLCFTIMPFVHSVQDCDLDVCVWGGGGYSLKKRLKKGKCSSIDTLNNNVCFPDVCGCFSHDRKISIWSHGDR